MARKAAQGATRGAAWGTVRGAVRVVARAAGPAGGRLRAALAVAVLAGALGGCGFHPLYEQAGARPMQARLDGVYVALIPNRQGQLLRQALQERLDAQEGTAKTLQLNVAYSIAEEAIGLQPDNSTSRTRAVATATWTLVRPSVPGSPLVTSGAAHAMDGFNTVNEQFFFSVLENEAAQRRLAVVIADQITLQVAAYLRAHPAAA